MRPFRFWLCLIAALAVPPLCAAQEGPGGFVLTTDRYRGPNFVPAFVGNGYLGARIPFDGQGFSDRPPTLAEVQGFFGTGKLLPWLPTVERRAALPAWASLDYDDGSGRYGLDRGVVNDYRQSLDLRSSTLTTAVVWTSPAGHKVALHYDVVPDRARPHAALVRLRLTPFFAGRVVITDSLDPRTGDLIESTATGGQGDTQYLDVRTRGLGVAATVASTLLVREGTVKSVNAPDSGVAQQVTLDVNPGQTYEILKAVGIAVSTDEGASSPPHERAIAAAQTEARLGYERAKADSDAAWSQLWASDIEVDGDAELQLSIRAALFGLFASARDDISWAPSPGGLSTDGYMGHVFWDSETWMFPAYLAVAPGIARQLLQYRIDRLPPALANAARNRERGARFPWESALSGDEAVPLPIFRQELHISSDIALAAWQYWLASGDRDWLARAYPMLAGIADFWVSYSSHNSDGSRSIRHVVPPDEDALGRGPLGILPIYLGGGLLTDDSIYTNATARQALLFATHAATALGRTADKAWMETANRLRLLRPDADGVVPEYAGYGGGSVRQADVTLLFYPWDARVPAAKALANLDYYAPRANPDAPAMTDAINAIIDSQIGAPGCAAFTFMQDSFARFMRPPYRQFAETRSDGVMTFLTGAGGFLQEFLYGYTGLRWDKDALRVDPSLPPQLSGVTIAGLHWRGRVITIAARPESTTLTLRSGPTMQVESPAGSSTLSPDMPVTLETRLPAWDAMSDDAPNAALCRPALDSSPEPHLSTAANDGSSATVWVAETAGESLTIDLERAIPIASIAISRPPAVAIAGHSRLGPQFALPVILTPQQGAGEAVEISADGAAWTRIGQAAPDGLQDILPVGGKIARYVRVVAPDATPDRPAAIAEIVVREQH